MGRHGAQGHFGKDGDCDPHRRDEWVEMLAPLRARECWLGGWAPMSSVPGRSPGIRPEPNTHGQAQSAPGVRIWAPLMGVCLAIVPTWSRLYWEVWPSPPPPPKKVRGGLSSCSSSGRVLILSIHSGHGGIGSPPSPAGCLLASTPHRHYSGAESAGRRPGPGLLGKSTPAVVQPNCQSFPPPSPLLLARP